MNRQGDAIPVVSTGPGQGRVVRAGSPPYIPPGPAAAARLATAVDRITDLYVTLVQSEGDLDWLG